MHLLLPNQFIFVTSLVVWLSNHDSSQHWGQILLKFTFNSLTFKISWKPRYLCILLMHLIQHPILKTKIRTFKNFLTNYNMVYKSCLFIWYCKICFNWSKNCETQIRSFRIDCWSLWEMSSQHFIKTSSLKQKGSNANDEEICKLIQL